MKAFFKRFFLLVFILSGLAWLGYPRWAPYYEKFVKSQIERIDGSDTTSEEVMSDKSIKTVPKQTTEQNSLIITQPSGKILESSNIITGPSNIITGHRGRAEQAKNKTFWETLSGFFAMDEEEPEDASDRYARAAAGSGAGALAPARKKSRNSKVKSRYGLRKPIPSKLGRSRTVDY